MDKSDLPTISKEKFDECYSLMLTKTLKRRLVELKTFGNVDVPKWLRGLIERELDAINKLD